MIYLIGGAPRAGKSTFGQQLAAKLNIGWIGTDTLFAMFSAIGVAEIPAEWDATPASIKRVADWFFPCLERFLRSIDSQAEHYLIEGAHFLPAHVEQLDAQYAIRSLFLGCSDMTLEKFDRFPGRSRGYAALSKDMRQQIAHDVPLWSAFIQQECQRFDCTYIDTSGDFTAQLSKAEALVLGL